MTRRLEIKIMKKIFEGIMSILFAVGMLTGMFGMLLADDNFDLAMPLVFGGLTVALITSNVVKGDDEDDEDGD